ncbi:hypothetical protein VTN02DRAFT_6129 [Thermoascus thermophilus]
MTTAVLTTSSTRTTRREPLSTIDMAASQAHARSASSSTGRGRGRRASARLNKEEESHHGNGDGKDGSSSRAVNGAFGLNSNGNGTKGGAAEKKRKAGEYDEDADGFQFTRITSSKKARPSLTGGVSIPEPVAEEPAPRPSPKRGRPPKGRPAKATAASTDGAAEEGTSAEATTRKTTRSTRGNAKRSSPEPAPATTTTKTKIRKVPEPESPLRSSTRKKQPGDADPFPPAPVVEKTRKRGRPSKSHTETTAASAPNGFVSPEPPPAGTSKIALPVADTPVIRRNKEMRSEKAGKGQRRSSLGMRGRRASSLIESGASNALPHKEVDTKDFYKHIASEGLSEPRRMRQLLTWCATRALGEKPSGSRSDDESARLAARVIQEELLKDFANVSELSDWFGREDKEPPAVVVKKPNPRNIQNAEKIKELEEQIQRLQQERHSLNALLKQPSIPRIKPPRPSGQRPEGQPPDQTNAQSSEQIPSSSTDPSSSQQPPESEPIDTSLLDPSQQALLASLSLTSVNTHRKNEQSTEEPSSSHQQPPPSTSAPPPTSNIEDTLEQVTARLSRITTSLAPTLDSFAAGVHDIELYRSAADSVSSQILRICAQRLEERDARNTLERLEIEGDGNDDEGGGGEDGRSKGRVRIRRERPKEDLGLVLGALSRVERR